jgi:hypothetical protein
LRVSRSDWQIFFINSQVENKIWEASSRLSQLSFTKDQMEIGGWALERDVKDFPAWPCGIKEKVHLQHMEMFGELANLLDYFKILTAIALWSDVGRGRYQEEIPLNYLAKWDHFPQWARGHGIDPNDTHLPLDDLSSLHHVLDIELKELNSVNATNIVDRRRDQCLSISRGIRALTAADGLVVDLAQRMDTPDEIKPYEIVENKKFEINKLGLTRGSKVLRIGSLETIYPAPTIISGPGASISGGDHVTQKDVVTKGVESKAAALAAINENDILEELSLSAEAPVSQIVGNIGDHL